MLIYASDMLIFLKSCLQGDNRLEAYAKKFQINDRSGDPLFYADEKEVYLGAKRLNVAGIVSICRVML